MSLIRAASWSFALSFFAPALDAQLAPAPPRVKPAHYDIPAGWDEHTITVKFRDGLLVRLRDGQLADLGTGALRGAEATLERLRGGVWSRTHSLPEEDLERMRVIGEQRVGFPLHDLNLQFRWRAPAGFDPELAIDLLNALEQVEMAEAIPLPEPPPQAPDYRGDQGYMRPSPQGVGAVPAWGVPDGFSSQIGAGAGANVPVCDIEYGFNPGHVDLPWITQITSPGYSNPSFDDHGTAVLGQLFARNDGYGTSGIAHLATPYFAHGVTAPNPPTYPYGQYAIENAISTFANAWAFQAGGVLLIEAQIKGPHWAAWHPPSPNPPFDPQYPDRQLGLVPVEWHAPTWQAIRDAIAYAGVTVIEAAGNGNEDLDHLDYYVGHKPFAPEPGSDSGAIIVGAGASPSSWMADRSRLSNLTTFGYEWGSNFGSRVDAQGWGDGIVTTGYGDLYNASANEEYTQQFGGTSGASPCVAGICAIVQARHKQQFGPPLDPDELRCLVRGAGSPQTSGTNPASEHIGKRPDVMKMLLALNLYSPMDFARGFEAPIGGFGTDNYYVSSMAVFDDDGAGPHPSELYVGGQFAMVGGVPATNIAKWTGSGWKALGGGVSYGTPWQYNGGVLSMAVHDADGAGPQIAQLYVGGLFTNAGGVPAQMIARWNGTSWSAVGSGVNGGSYGVWALASLDEDGAGPLQPSLVAGGDFTSIGGVAVQRVARWRSNAWSAMGSGFDERVQALEVYDADDTGPQLARVVAGGMFSQSGAGVPMRNLALWNGASWSELGGGAGGFPNQIFALESVPIAGSQQQFLCVGGSFIALGGTPADQFGVWTGSSWFVPGNQPFDVPPFALHAFDDGTDPIPPFQSMVYLESYLVPPSGPSTSTLYRLDPTTWTYSQVSTFQNNSNVEELISFDEDGDGVTPPALWCGGGFNQAGSTSSTNIAKFLGLRILPATPYCTAKTNSLGCEPMIQAAGMPSASQPGGFWVSANNLLNQKSGLLIYSLTGRKNAPYQGGTLCVQAPLRRSPVLNSSGSPPQINDCSGMFSIDMNAFAQGGLGGNPDPALRDCGTQVNCQFWGRDPGFAPPNNTMLTSALEFLIGL